MPFSAPAMTMFILLVFCSAIDGIDDQLAIQQAHANRGDGIGERQVGDIGRRRSRGYGNDVRIIFAVRGQHHGDDLCLISPGIGKQRPHRPVNQS